MLLFIAVRLLADSQKRDEEAAHAADSATAPVRRGMLAALVTILLADVTMSLDNVLAIGALAHGDIPLLVVG